MLGLTLDDIEIIDHVIDESTGASHFLIDDGNRDLHLWTPDRESLSLDHLEKPELLKMMTSQVEDLRDNRSIETEAGNEFTYQRFGPWKEDIIGHINKAEGSPKINRENGDLRLRLDSGGTRYNLYFKISGLKGPTGEMILSRLNSTGFKNSPVLLGMSYWDDGGIPSPWMKFTRVSPSSGSGFRPFLSDLRRIMEEFQHLPDEKARKYLVKMSGSRGPPSLMDAYRMGKVLGDIHGRIMLDEKVRASGKRGIGSEITELFNPTRFKTGDVGSILGLTSFYLIELKKEFTKLLGDRQRINPESGRRMKVLKHQRTMIEGVDLFDMGLLREGFLKREKTIRSRFSSLRQMTGSPMVPIGIDSRLDRIEISPEGEFIIEHFDWEPFSTERGEIKKFIPLKDLAMVLNSFNKARYLASRQKIKSLAASVKIDERHLVSLFLEYNLAKVSYNKIMKDFNLFRAVSRRIVPFRYIFSISVIGSLWFERMRNGLVKGYTEQLQSMNKDNLLDYPKRMNTVEATDTIRSMIGLSSSLRILKHGKVASSIGLESELINSICYLDQA